MKERGTCRLSGGKANQLTKECLQKALIYLLGEKPFDKISITELVKTSGVSRQSFYRNYKSKEDILRELSENFYKEIKTFVKKRLYSSDIYQWYYDLFLFVKQNKENIRLLLMAVVNQTGSKKYLPALHKMFETCTKEDYYRLLAYEGAINTVVIDWFEHGMEEDCSYMANLCNELYGDAHRRLLAVFRRDDADESAVVTG